MSQDTTLAVEERQEDTSAPSAPRLSAAAAGAPHTDGADLGLVSPAAPEQPRLALPVDSLREAAPYLRRPFTVKAVQWKVQSAFKDKGFLAVGYIDARLVVDRLNVVCPHIWQEEIEELPSGLFLCRLTIDGTTHSDVGEGSGTTKTKAGYSDALKRAAVKFGVGVSVYKIPRAEIWASDQSKSGYFTYKHIPGSGSKKEQHVYRLTTEGEAALRGRYDEWLKRTGIETYGEPIEHGDVEDSAGGLADDERVTDAATEPATNDLPNVKVPLTDEKADVLRQTCRTIYAKVKKSKMPAARFESELAQSSTSHEALEAFAEKLRGMAE